MGRILFSMVFLLGIISCRSQTEKSSIDREVGGPCQGCEAAEEYGDQELKSIDTLPDFLETDPKMKISGTVYNSDGKTPAKDVVLYFYHTDRDGLYANGDSKVWGRVHGRYRSWVKTDSEGKYTIYTFRPAAYPNTSEPEHVHITVKENGLIPYYIDSIVFDDDPLLTKEEREGLTDRGGSGIATPVLKNGLLEVEKDIFLGKNIPGY